MRFTVALCGCFLAFEWCVDFAAFAVVLPLARVFGRVFFGFERDGFLVALHVPVWWMIATVPAPRMVSSRDAAGEQPLQHVDVVPELARFVGVLDGQFEVAVERLD